MAQKKKLSRFHKFCIISSVLIVVQLISLFFLKSKAPKGDFKEALSLSMNELDGQDESSKVFVQIQLALSDYSIKNSGYPETLSELVPEYFEKTPINPDTGEAYEYKISGDSYELLFDNDASKSKKTKKEKKKDSEDIDIFKMVDKSNIDDSYVYDPRGKRDPFQAFDFTPQFAGKSSGTPLESYPYEDLKITAIMKGFGEPKAIVEDPSGKGHTITVESKIGNYGGKVVKIEDDKILILETIVDFTGEKQTRTVEMFLR